MALLQTRNLAKYFGGLCAVSHLDLDVFSPEILGVIGPNGAGKTTLFNMISGFFSPTTGNIFFEGEDITGLKADQISQKGIGRTFQASTLFMQSTAFDNVFTGFHMHYKQRRWKAFLHTPSSKDEERAMKQRTTEILELTGLIALKDELAQNLPHGHQRTLGICIALATNPKLLLLDEPMTGMNPTETIAMIDKIRQIRDRGVTIMLVEHNMRAIMRVCDRIVVLNYGKKIAEGPPQEIKENKEVIEAYLGRGQGAAYVARG
jgi:branched-chain amino acid transport system ATP-binding protein